MARATNLLEIYRDPEGYWRWRFVATNGRILAVSSEGYRARGDALRCAAQVCDFRTIEVDYSPTLRNLWGYIQRQDVFALEVVSR